MAQTRRTFLQSAALTLGAVGTPLTRGDAHTDQRPGGGARGEVQPDARPALPVSQIQIPRIRFANAEISRLVIGCNPFYGFAHFNNILSAVMSDYYTAERVCDVLHQCNRFGINAYNYVNLGRAPHDLERFRAEGGQMHLIVQGMGDPAPLVKDLAPLAMYHHGGRTDRAFQDGKIADVRDWCKRVRDLGVTVGVGSHKPEVIALVEEQGWDVDFYAGCVYNVTRTPDEWRRVLSGELLEMPGEIYLQSDPPRMYRVMRQTRKPCFAFKILAAGRINEREADQAFGTAFDNIKPGDGVFVGMFPRIKDEVRENAERVHRLLVTRRTAT
jgi:hypothetical protein